MTTDSSPATRYIAPGAITRRIGNPLVNAIVALGITPWGASTLEVQGRTTGQWRALPVNVLTVDGRRHLVAPRGETQWVRNLRAAGGAGRIRAGRRRTPFTAVEVTDSAAKVPVLRAYLDRFGWEVGKFVEGLTASSTDAELLAAAPGFPVFRIADGTR